MEGNGSVQPNNTLGIDTNKIYFREEIAALWGYPLPDRGSCETADDFQRDKANLNNWFTRNFKKKGLRTFSVANRVAVHGAHLAEWISFNSKIEQ